MKGTKPGIARKRPDLSQARVRELLSYTEDGNLVWRPIEEITRHQKRRNTLFANKVAGYLREDLGYFVIKVEGYNEQLHRMIYLWHYGILPPVVDHKDGDKTNNRIDNLRAATQHTNGLNTRRSKVNKSGVKGVHWHKRDCKWVAQVKIAGKTCSLGYFEDIREAERAVVTARKLHHGDFANNG